MSSSAAGIVLAGASALGASGAAPFTFDDSISADAAAPIAAPIAAKRRFGEANDLRFNVLAGAASDFANTEIAQGGVGLSWFALDSFSVELELLGMGVFQDEGDDAAGADLNVLFRWHFWHDEAHRISVYGDAGVGFALFSEEVPPGGTNFNFAPQIGAGASFELQEGTRLLVGVRWLHLSNARLGADNDGIDTVLVYAGLSWGF